jgi:hypothetical protein
MTVTEVITVKLHYSLPALQPCVGSWCPPLFRNNTFLLGGVVSNTTSPKTWLIRDYISSGTCLLTYLALAALPRTYVPASINLHATGAHIPPHHVKVVVLKKTIN